MGISATHLILVVIILAILFLRPQNIKGLGKSIGLAMRNFKDAMNEIEVDKKDIKEIKTQSAQKSEQETQKKS